VVYREIPWLTTACRKGFFGGGSGLAWAGSNIVYVAGARVNKWTLEGINWTIGKTAFTYTLGGCRFNSFYSMPQIAEEGRVMISAL
jgi:hypothetical protein